MQGSKRISNYVFQALIGKGSFAEVYKGHNQTTKQEVAIKMIPRSRLPKEDGSMIEKEVTILYKLSHPNIVQLMDFQKTLNNYYLIFEFCKYGDLEKFIHDNYGGRVPEFQAQKIIQQIIEGIKFMKERNIVHRDLKLANLLVAKDFVVKIADFGFARFVDESENLFKSYVGTPLTMAPEILERHSYTENCDMWSLGIIFYQIIVGRLPFDPGRGANTHDLIQLIKRKPVEFPIDLPVSQSVKDLIKQMLILDERKRMTFEDLFKNEWVTGAYEVPDPSKTVLPQDLNASVLLRSAYDARRMNDKINKEKEKLKRTTSLNADGNQKADNVIPSSPINQPANPTEDFILNKLKKVENSPDKEEGNTVPIVQVENSKQAEGDHEKDNGGVAEDVAMDHVKWKEIYECLLISKVYEVLKEKCELLLEKMKKINEILLSRNICGDSENSSILPVLVIMQMLSMIKDTLMGKVTVSNESNSVNLVDLQLTEFWENFVKIQTIVVRFTGENSKIVDIYKELKKLYVDSFKKMENEISKLSIDKFRGHDPDDLLYDTLLRLSENTALNEYISEKEERLEQYAILDLICDIILFKKSETWYELELISNSKLNKYVFDAGFKLQDIAQNHTDYLRETIKFDFKKLSEIMQREGNMKIIKCLREQFALRAIPKSNPDEVEASFLNKIKLLHEQIVGRISDLSE
jgi:serine/threonine protein kinase